MLHWYIENRITMIYDTIIAKNITIEEAEMLENSTETGQPVL